jgi:hypothetical protein
MSVVDERLKSKVEGSTRLGVWGTVVYYKSRAQEKMYI